MASLDESLKVISELIGRDDVVVDGLKDGSYIVLYMRIGYPPPPTGATPEEAAENFIAWFKAMPKEIFPEV